MRLPLRTNYCLCPVHELPQRSFGVDDHEGEEEELTVVRQAGLRAREVHVLGPWPLAGPFLSTCAQRARVTQISEEDLRRRTFCRTSAGNELYLVPGRHPAGVLLGGAALLPPPAPLLPKCSQEHLVDAGSKISPTARNGGANGEPGL